MKAFGVVTDEEEDEDEDEELQEREREGEKLQGGGAVGVENLLE